jgi:hypothetical protein
LFDTTISRFEVTVNVVLPVPETIHSDPMAQGFHLLPDIWVSFLNPCFNVCLLLAIGGAIEPAAETV